MVALRSRLDPAVCSRSKDRNRRGLALVRIVEYDGTVTMTESSFLIDEYGTKFNMWNGFRGKGFLMLFFIYVIVFQCFICEYLVAVVQLCTVSPSSVLRRTSRM